MKEEKALKIINDLEERARRGAIWLDEKLPNWENKIKPDDLSMQDGQFCIFGQLFTDFTTGLEKNGMTGKRSAELGLLVEDKEQRTIEFDHQLGSLLIPVEVEPYQVLDAAWVNEVRSRKRAKRAAQAAARAKK